MTQTLTTKALAKLLCEQPITVAYVCENQGERAFAVLALCVAIENDAHDCSAYSSMYGTLNVKGGAKVYFVTDIRRLRGLSLDLVIFDSAAAASVPASFELALSRLRGETNMGVQIRG